MDQPEVIELIEYCQELEGKFMEVEINKQYDKEDILINLIRDIYESCNVTMRDEEDSIRFGETQRVDFKNTIGNLKKYIDSIDKLYKLGL